MMPWLPENATDRSRELSVLAQELADSYAPELVGEIAEMFRLILDLLALVPPEHDVSKARESVSSALRRREL
jgi:hypothetical protein